MLLSFLVTEPSRQGILNKLSLQYRTFSTRKTTISYWILYNYPPKGRWIVVNRGIYLALQTDPEGGSCFSIYQISWIKIKKKLFVNKRRRLVRVCLCWNWQCFGDHFLWLCCKFSKKMFFYRAVNADNPNFVSFLVFVGEAASFTAKISSFETVAKPESRPTTVNIQGYSELRQPIRTPENHYPLIWWILNM